MATSPFVARNGVRVEVSGKGLIGTISYIGMTTFAPGKWVGVTLDEPNGKNDGEVQGKRYFTCPPNHGIFVRQTQLVEYVDKDVRSNSPSTTSAPPASGLSKISGLRKPGASPLVKSSDQPAVKKPQSGIPAGKPGRLDMQESSIRSPSPSNIGKFGMRPKTGIAQPSSVSSSVESATSSPATAAPETPKQSFGMSKIGGLQKGTGLARPGSLSTPRGSKLGSSEVTRPDASESVMETSSTCSTGSAGMSEKSFSALSKTSTDASIDVKDGSEGLVRSKPNTPKFEASKPDFFPSSPSQAVEPPAPAHKVVAASEEVLELQRRLIEKEKACVDLDEKLNVLKQKRQQDQAKIKEIDKLKLQNQQFAEYKAKWQESQRELQAQIRQYQNEAREAAEKISTDNDLTEVNEALEMATLDKEMAEEKYESLVQEHEQLKEKHEEVSLELEILKNEISEGGVESIAATAEMKQLEQQNVRLKDALIKLKDIAQNDKGELALSQRQNKEFNQQLTDLAAEKNKLQERLQIAESQVDDLKEQVDFALGAEEMVEKLTDKNLELEEEIEKLQETVQDLEQLRELNEEFEENHVQTEHDLREELDMADNKIRELERQITAHIEQGKDYQATIVKFRELVQTLQGRISDLHDQSVESIPAEEIDITPVPEIDFQTKIFQTKQYGRIIELELNKYYVAEANKQVDMVNQFLPEHFTKRGADYDGICLLLLMERLKFKCNLLSNQLHEKHDIGEIVDAGQPLSGSKGDEASYACLLAYNLSNFYAIVSQYSRALNACDVGTFIRVSGQYPELAVHEKIVDNYIELLCKDLLDDTVSLEVLDKTINQYKNFYKLHLASAPRNCTSFLADVLIRFTNGAEAVSIDTQRLKSLAKGCQEGSSFLVLLNAIELKNMEIKQLCRKIKRRMVQDSNTTLSYPESITQQMLDVMEDQNSLVKYMQDLASVLSLKAEQLSDGESLLTGDLEESAQDCITLVFEKDTDAMETLSEYFTKVLSCLSGIAIKLQEGDYDAEPESDPSAPYLERASAFKEELSCTTKLELKIDQKQHEVNEVKKSLKVKVDELSEANIRIQLLDKRAENAAKEAGTKVEQMGKKLETLQKEYQEKASQNEKTMDALQSDISDLEEENSDLKKKLETYAKKTNLDLARLSQSSSAMAGIVSPGKPGSAMASLSKAGVAGTSPVQVVLKDSPVLLQQLESQKKALEYLQKENWDLKATKWKAELAKLPKPYKPKMVWKDGKFIPNQNQETANVTEGVLSSKAVLKDCKTLHKNLQDLAVFPKVVDITGGLTADGKFKPLPEEQLAQQQHLLRTLSKQKDDLTKKVESVITMELPGAKVQSHLRNFVSPEYARLKQEDQKPIHIATIKIPKADASVKGGVRNVCITPQEFAQINEKLTMKV